MEVRDKTGRIRLYRWRGGRDVAVDSCSGNEYRVLGYVTSKSESEIEVPNIYSDTGKSMITVQDYNVTPLLLKERRHFRAFLKGKGSIGYHGKRNVSFLEAC